jgi:hypothetical protein
MRRVPRRVKFVLAIGPLVASLIAIGGLCLTTVQIRLVQKNLDLQSKSVERADSSLKLISAQIQLQREQFEEQKEERDAEYRRYLE